jgi:hypothetical protein
MVAWRGVWFGFGRRDAENKDAIYFYFYFKKKSDVVMPRQGVGKWRAVENGCISVAFPFPN